MSSSRNPPAAGSERERPHPGVWYPGASRHRIRRCPAPPNHYSSTKSLIHPNLSKRPQTKLSKPNNGNKQEVITTTSKQAHFPSCLHRHRRYPAALLARKEPRGGGLAWGLLGLLRNGEKKQAKRRNPASEWMWGKDAWRTEACAARDDAKIHPKEAESKTTTKPTDQRNGGLRIGEGKAGSTFLPVFDLVGTVLGGWVLRPGRCNWMDGICDLVDVK